MPMLITRKEAADHLKLDDVAAEVSDLDLKISAASAAVLNEIEMTADDFASSDSDAEYDVPDLVKQAILLLVGDFHRNRTPGTDNYNDIGLPKAIKALLYPLKTWGIEES